MKPGARGSRRVVVLLCLVVLACFVISHAGSDASFVTLFPPVAPLPCLAAAGPAETTQAAPLAAADASPLSARAPPRS